MSGETRVGFQGEMNEVSGNEVADRWIGANKGMLNNVDNANKLAVFVDRLEQSIQ